MKREAIIAAADEAIAKYEADKIRYANEVKEWQQKRRERWFAEDLPHLKALRDMLTQKIRHGETISYDEMKRAVRAHDGWGQVSDHAWAEDRNPNSREVSPPIRIDVDGLKALKRTIEAISDPEVSDGQLERLGFRKMYNVFRAAAGVP